jgi:hypothetical protein
VAEYEQPPVGLEGDAWDPALLVGEAAALALARGDVQQQDGADGHGELPPVGREDDVDRTPANRGRRPEGLSGARIPPQDAPVFGADRERVRSW